MFQHCGEGNQSHFISVKAGVQRSELTCSETLSGSPVPGARDVGEMTEKSLPSGSLHSFLTSMCMCYVITHSLSIFIKGLKGL